MSRAQVLEVPALVPYFGPRPAWIRSRRPLSITVTEGVYRSRDGIVVTVPAGYVTDLASTPRLIWPILPPHGQLIIACLPHDWGYSHGGAPGFLPKAWWDALFRDLLEITPKVSPWKIPVAYAAVRIGGKGGWKYGWEPFEAGQIPDWPALGQV